VLGGRGATGEILKRRRPTLADIAKRTGFGTNTVSLALRHSTRISKATRSTILAAARDLDYVPNRVAKALAVDRSNTVGLLLHDITNPSLTRAAKLIQLELARRGYSVLFATSDGNFEEELRAIDVFRSHMIDGLLIYPLIHDRLEHLVELRSKNFPVVLLIGADEAPLDAVGVDEYRGGYSATRHLIELGHSHIGLIGGGTVINDEKIRGYRAALEESGIAFDSARIGLAASHSIEGGIEATEHLMTNSPGVTAIFAMSDVLGLGALRWAAMHKVAVPSKLSIVGFDNNEDAQHSFVPLTTYLNDAQALATAAVDRLVQLIESKGELPPPITKHIEGRVIVRESTRRRPGSSNGGGRGVARAKPETID
jgi:LacI family transcriptional regulator